MTTSLFLAIRQPLGFSTALPIPKKTKHGVHMKTADHPLRAAIYARVSTDRQSTENQLRELRQAAQRLGWNVVGEFVDNGISGAKGRKDRPQLDAMLKGVSRKDFDVVASWSVDRKRAANPS
jgi:predicted site-specific integrase-resolvase